MLSSKQPTNISEHINATSGKSFRCFICDRDFEVKCALTKHILNVHWDSRPHTCEKCGRRFLMKTSLERHMLTHKEVKCWPNEVGEKLYSSIQSCQKTYEEEQEFRGHFLQTRNRLPAPLPCGICGRNFNNKSSLQRHITGVHFHKYRPYACTKCKKTFKDKFNCENHSIICDNVLKPFTCHHCDKRFRKKFTLKRHIIDVHSQQRPHFACSHCGKRFKQKSDLRRHSLTHYRNSMQSYFICNQCNKKFISKSNLEQHIIGDHSCDKRLYDCEKYGDKSKREDNYHVHCCALSSIIDEDNSERSTVGLHNSSHPGKAEFGSVYKSNLNVSHLGALSSDNPNFKKKSSNYSTPPNSTIEYQCNSCPGCRESFESYNLLIKHVQSCAEYDSILNREKGKLGDRSLERQFWCGVCYLPLVSLRTFISHLKLAHNVTFLYHKCDDSCYDNIIYH